MVSSLKKIGLLKIKKRQIKNQIPILHKIIDELATSKSYRLRGPFGNKVIR